MMPDSEYAANLLWSVQPTDRALAGWGDWQHRQAQMWLGIEAECQDMRDAAAGNEAA